MGSRLNPPPRARALLTEELDRVLSDSGSFPQRRARDLKVAWYPGTVRPYESLYGVAAKVCIANRLKAEDFVKWADAIAPNPNSSEHGEYWERWSIKALLRSLGEPAWLDETVGLRFSLTATRGAGCVPRGESDATKFCRICLKEGYHSALHGEYLLRRCFVHQEELLTRDTTNGFVGVVRFLIRLWSGDTASFPLPPAFRWPRMLLDHRSVVDATIIVSELYETERKFGIQQAQATAAQKQGERLSSVSEALKQPFPRGKGHFEFDFEDDGAYSEAGEVHQAATEQRPIRDKEYVLDREEQKAVLQDRPDFLLTRAASVIAQGKWPCWRKLHHQVARDLLKQHHSCKTIYESLDERDLHHWLWLKTEQSTGWDSLPGRLRLAHFETPCVRVDSQEVWADLLSNLADFFYSSGWRGTGVPPEEIESTASGQVEELADELLGEFVRAFAWALHDTEPTVDLSSRRPDVRRNWLKRCAQYMPKYQLTRLEKGVRLRLQSRMPAQAPDFVTLDSEGQREHASEVRRAIARGSSLYPHRFVEHQ